MQGSASVLDWKDPTGVPLGYPGELQYDSTEKHIDIFVNHINNIHNVFVEKPLSYQILNVLNKNMQIKRKS